MKTELVKYAQKSGTIASLIGLVVGISIIYFWLDLAEMLTEEGLWMYNLVGCSIMILASRWLTNRIGNSESKFLSFYILSGIGASLLAIIIGSLSGSSVFIIFNQTQVELADAGVYLYAPLFWIGLFGGLPASIIGGIWGGLVWKRKKSLQ